MPVVAAALAGVVQGHPLLPGRRAVVTSRLVALDARAGWARTLSRWYRLGDPDEAGTGTPRAPRLPRHRRLIRTSERGIGVHAYLGAVRLHRDIGGRPFAPPRIPEADVAVVSGDVCAGLVRSVEWVARTILPHMPVVLVVGNHEFYGSEPDEELRRGSDVAAREGVHLLENRTVEVVGPRFSGCSLWTDYELDGADRRDGAMAAAMRGMNDHRFILGPTGDGVAAGPFLPEHALSRHLRSLAFLRATLLRTHAHAARTVVVTHHAPHPGSVHRRWFGDPLSPAFASDLGDLLAAAQPALWVHGHTHSSFDYRVRATRVVCNPKGYGGENPSFDPALVVEVSP